MVSTGHRCEGSYHLGTAPSACVRTKTTKLFTIFVCQTNLLKMLALCLSPNIVVMKMSKLLHLSGHTGQFTRYLFGILFTFIGLATWILASPARSEDYMREVPVARKALVIGVSEYNHLPKLPVSNLDAKNFKTKLENNGFTVVEAEGSDRRSLLNAIARFTDTLNEGDIALVYYSGHGFQRNEFNYIVPSDSPLCPGDVVRENIPESHINLTLEKRKIAVYLLILDACRTTPHDCQSAPADRARTIRDAFQPPSPGLAERMAPREGEVLFVSWMTALAASPGRPAWSGSDGSGGSLYSSQLRKFFGKKGWDLDKTFDVVRLEVRQASSGQQIPSEQRFMYGDVFIDPDDRILSDYKLSWETILALGNPKLIADAAKEYLYMSPGSPYAAMARQWLKDNAPDVSNITSGMQLISAAEPAPATDDRPSAVAAADPEAEPRLRSLARSPASDGEGSPLRTAEAAGRKFFVAKGRQAPALSAESDRRGARGDNAKMVQLAQNTKTKVLTLEKPEAKSPRAPAPSKTQIKAVDGVPVGELLPPTPGGSASEKVSVPLTKLFPDKRQGRSAANPAFEQFGELQGSEVEVELSDVSPDAPTQGHARMEAFQRSLQIRKDLQESGVEPDKIIVKMPEKFVLDGQSRSPQIPQDQLKISKPEK